MKKLSQNEFIQKVKEKFPNYDFSKSIYVNNKTKLLVICSKHGEFSIRPDCLLTGTGCPYCGGTKKNNTETFIEKANYVHNNFFSYEKCEYINSNSKVIVTCPIHGDFEVKANNHLNGCNCKKCQIEGKSHEIKKLPSINTSTKKLTTEEFIKKAILIYDDKYTYEKCKYVKSNVKVIITCPIHGDFEITPNHFLSNRGCPKCGGNYRLNTQEFIEKLKIIHGEKYYYDKIEYKSTHKPVLLICPKHGEFINTPANLLKGQGCPYCSESKMEIEITNFLKEHNIKFEKQKKFDWLKHKKRLPLDFYLPDYNIAIECQGEQHFEPIKIFGGEESFILNQQRDKVKKTLCEEHNLTILYYSTIKKKYFKNFPYVIYDNLESLYQEILKKQKYFLYLRTN